VSTTSVHKSEKKGVCGHCKGALQQRLQRGRATEVPAACHPARVPCAGKFFRRNRAEGNQRGGSAVLCGPIRLSGLCAGSLGIGPCPIRQARLSRAAVA
jgi:hypothetical protein